MKLTSFDKIYLHLRTEDWPLLDLAFEMKLTYAKAWINQIFRIQRVKKDTELSLLPITEELWDLSLCTISLTKTHLMLFKIGKALYHI